MLDNYCRKLGGAAKHLIDSSEKRICRLSFEFTSCMLLKGAVSEAVDSTLCEKEEGAIHHRLECLMRQCGECGIRNLKLSREEKSTDVLVKWKRYEYVTCDRQKRRRAMKNSTGYKRDPSK